MNKKKSITDSKITKRHTEGVSESFRLSASEADEFDKLVKMSGMTKTDFIKSAVFSEKISFLDGGNDLIITLAECAEEMRKINAILSRKNFSDVTINDFLNEIKEHQRSLGFRMSDVEKRIADIFERLYNIEGGKNNDH